MPRTVTGSYILRPTSYNSYLSSGTFTDYFASSPSSPSTWKSKMNMTTQIGDDSDSTYYADTGVTSGNAYAENALMNLTCPAGGVPVRDYTITGVQLNYRAQSSAQTDAARKLNLWFSIWDTDNGANPTAAINSGGFGMMVGYESTSSLHTSTTSVATHSFNVTAFSNPDMSANTAPNMMAICARAWKTSGLVSFSWWRLYDVWFVVSYEYEEPTEVTDAIFVDEGVTISGDVSATSYPGLSITDEEGTEKTLIASVADGYTFDGWYTGGTKVSSDLTYKLTMAADIVLYALAKKRGIYVGTHQVEEVYLGTTAVELYDGSTKIFGDSDLLSYATGG